MQPLVTVVIPAFNAQSYICQCIESILNQSYRNIQIIVIDDCSTDHTLNRIKQYERHKNLHIHINKKNEGVSRSRNTGILNSSGKYIAFQDSDDFSEPQRIATQVEFFEGDNIEKYHICGSWSRNISDAGSFNIARFPRRYVKEFGIENCSFRMSSIMVRRKSIIDRKILFNPLISIGEDYEFQLSMLGVGECDSYDGYNIPAPLVNYRIHHSSLSHGANSPKTHQFSRKKRLDQFRLIRGSLSCAEVKLIDEIFSSIEPCQLQDLERFALFFDECVHQLKPGVGYSKKGLTIFFGTVLLNAFLRKKSTNIKDAAWLIKNLVPFRYIQAFSTRDLLWKLRTHL